MITVRFCTLLSMTLAAGLVRLLPHWPNFTPIGAMALFGGAYFLRRRAAFAVPLSAMLVSDAILGATRYGWAVLRFMPIVYGCFAATVVLGMLLRKRRTALSVVAAALSSSVLFFIVTNFAVWFRGTLYPHTAAGLAECYIAAIPFFQNTVAGDVFFSAVLFGGFELAQRRWPALRAIPTWTPRGGAAT